MPDEIDLKQAFDRAAGLTPNAPAALAGLRTRIRKAHQRRALARGGAGLLGVVAVGGVIMNIGGDGSGTEVASTGPGASDTSLLTSTTLGLTSAPTVSTAPTTTLVSRSSAPTTGATTIDASIPPTTEFVPTTRPIVDPVAVFTAEGGTIVVDYTSSAMTLTSVAANPGWTVADTRAKADDIDVRFENEDGDESRIRVRLVEGQPVQDEERRGSSDDGSSDDSGNDDSSGPGSGDDG